MEETRTAGAEYLLFPRTAFWWLEHYDGLRRHLADHYRVAAYQEGLFLLIDLRDSAPRESIAIEIAQQERVRG